MLEAAGPEGGLPVNVAFVFEGEQENGSAGLRDAVANNLVWFAGTTAVVVTNTLWVGERVPCLTYGCAIAWVCGWLFQTC